MSNQQMCDQKRSLYSPAVAVLTSIHCLVQTCDAENSLIQGSLIQRALDTWRETSSRQGRKGGKVQGRCGDGGANEEKPDDDDDDDDDDADDDCKIVGRSFGDLAAG